MLLVQKYGGTSVGDPERINRVAQRIALSIKPEHHIVVVVSAMSGETDKLLGYALHFDALPDPREVDMILSSGERVTSALLAIALQTMGYKAISLSGRNAGIYTDSQHTKAHIEYIDTTRINKLLHKGFVVIVAGFQGVNEKGDVTTLGRGGSDLSAVALAGALNADLCEIYTDVEGVFTTDPRIEPNAKKIDKISYDEMLELASMGAKVLLNRSVELAKKLGVKLITRSTFSDNPGTLITKEEDIMEQPIISGIALDKNQARVSMVEVKDQPGIASEIFGKLAEANINVDMIVQTLAYNGRTDLDFTIPKTELELAKNIFKSLDSDSFGKIEYDNDIAKVSIVGVGMKSHTGVASKVFGALAKEHINIMMISTSEIKISVLVDIKYAELSIRSLHRAFELDK